MALTGAFAKEHAGEIDIRFEPTTEKGKRKGLHRAIEMVEGMDIIICMDSDTILGDGVKQSILETFSKPGVGGVTVKQRVYKPEHLMHYMFDIRLVSRYNLEAPGQALGGYVSCLSGRCSAYLAGPLKEIKKNLVNEQWLGIRKTGGGEDKCLTTFLQDAGYRMPVINPLSSTMPSSIPVRRPTSSSTSLKASAGRGIPGSPTCVRPAGDLPAQTVDGQ